MLNDDDHDNDLNDDDDAVYDGQVQDRLGQNKNNDELLRSGGNKSWTTVEESIMSTTLRVSQLACLPKCATNSIMSFSI